MINEDTAEIWGLTEKQRKAFDFDDMVAYLKKERNLSEDDAEFQARVIFRGYVDLIQIDDDGDDDDGK